MTVSVPANSHGSFVTPDVAATRVKARAALLPLLQARGFGVSAIVDIASAFRKVPNKPDQVHFPMEPLSNPDSIARGDVPESEWYRAR